MATYVRITYVWEPYVVAVHETPEKKELMFHKNI